MPGAQLFEDHRHVQRWTGTTALALCAPGCPACGAPLIQSTVDQPALFVHGGYGATRRTTWAICVSADCRWSHERVIEEIRPDRRR